MKRLIYIGLLAFSLLASYSCSDYLDINKDPNTPSTQDASVNARLSGIQHYYLYAQGTAGARSAMITGAMTRNYVSGNAHSLLCAWDPAIGSSTTPYQFWFVGSAANLSDLEVKARDEGAWHYIGAAKIIRAMGFMLMTDWYGEMPYSEALTLINNAKYDDGKTIFEGCLADLDEAIKYLEMTQDPLATPLSSGDGWNGGSVDKWIKLAYGLKARWLNNLSKKSSLYDPQAILDALADAAQNNTEGTIIQHYNESSAVGDILFGDPLKTSILYDNVGMNNYFFATKWYENLLTNNFTGGSGVVDPRIDKLIPSAQYKINGTIQTVRSEAVDMINGDIRRVDNGPIVSTYNNTLGKWVVSTSNVNRMGDSIFVTMKSYGMDNTDAVADDDTYRGKDKRILTTGTYYTRTDAPTHLLSYSELCFIKAEVKFRQGLKDEALLAYKEGIKSNMELMNVKLSSYGSTDNVGKKPIAQTDIDAFMLSAAVAQNGAELTMAKIMQQKFIACSFSVQNWNDMRRFNYSAGNIGSFGVVYPDFDRPKEFTAVTKLVGTSKTDPTYWFRRIAQPTHERNYNASNMAASNQYAFLDRIWSDPVWWDIEE